MSTTVSKKRSSHNSKKGKVIDRKLFGRLYPYLSPYKWWVLLALGITLAISYLGPVRPYLTQIAVDKYISKGDYHGLLGIIGLLFLALVGESLLMIGNTYLTRWVGEGTLYRLRNAVFYKIENMHVQYFDRNPIGRLITRTTSDIEAIDQLVSSGVINMLGDLLRIFFIIGFMLSMNWELTLIALTTMPILIYATFLFKKKVRVSFLDVRDQIARLNSFIQEHISGMPIVQLFRRESKEAKRFEEINSAHRNAYINTIFYFALFWPTVEIISSLAMALVIWYGGAKSLSGVVTFGMLLAFIQYVRQFFLPIRDLSEKYNTLQSALAAAERIFSVLDSEVKIKNPENPVHLPSAKGNIKFEHVWFRYNRTEEYVLKDVTFEVEHGQTVAIVGATGAGKSTIISLLMRFYDIDKGSISLDNVDIRKADLASLRTKFGLVLQDNALFSGTIMDNITLGNENIKREDVIHAARLVEANRFIETLPGGYDYRLQERGASLSMGQRQLICFVRALVYNPKILVLDEATSSVDSETESIVNNAIDVLMKGRTSIVIAHRLSTIQHADKILVMHKGEIRERGTHKQLIRKKDGIYRKLYELQYKDQLVKADNKTETVNP